MEHNFKVGDTVYFLAPKFLMLDMDIQNTAHRVYSQSFDLLKGEIRDIYNAGSDYFARIVLSENDSIVNLSVVDNTHYESNYAYIDVEDLSFDPFDFRGIGFTQQRKFAVGEIGYFWNQRILTNTIDSLKSDIVQYGKISDISEYDNKPLYKTSSGPYFYNFSPTPPEL